MMESKAVQNELLSIWNLLDQWKCLCTCHPHALPVPQLGIWLRKGVVKCLKQIWIGLMMFSQKWRTIWSLVIVPVWHCRGRMIFGDLRWRNKHWKRWSTFMKSRFSFVLQVSLQEMVNQLGRFLGFTTSSRLLLMMKLRKAYGACCWRKQLTITMNLAQHLSKAWLRVWKNDTWDLSWNMKPEPPFDFRLSRDLCTGFAFLNVYRNSWIYSYVFPDSMS